MRGFRRRTSVEAALEWLDNQLPLAGQRPVERVRLQAAAGRVLAADVAAEVAVPQFRRAMMDGYAVRATDTLGASTYNPIPLAVVGQSLPGAPATEGVGPGQAVQIMTGAPMPSGATAVLPVESTSQTEQGVFAVDALPEGKHIGEIGEDIGAGVTVLAAGRLLRPQDLGVLSSVGRGTVDVVRRPRVEIVITGNEILPVGEAPRGSLIADANGPMLAALVERDGGRPSHQGIVADNRQAILDALHADADIVIVTGGSSVGQEDYVPTLLAEHGDLAIHGIAMRPSSPAGLGRLEHRLVFLLPGNPVSCLCAYDFFAGRAIRALGGRSQDWPYRAIRARFVES